MSIDLNWWAILVGIAVNMAVGFVWYSKSGFGKEWAKLVGRKLEDMGGDNAGQTYAITTLGAAVQILILAYLVNYALFFYPSWGKVGVGLFVAGLVWVGFVAIPQGVNTLFAGTRKKLWAINTAYFLVVLLINGVILASWR